MNSLDPKTKKQATARPEVSESFSILETFPNRSQHRNYLVRFQIPEFTCVCPRTGFPDFARIEVEYEPGRRCVELKSLKLYINDFRDRGIFHEDVANTILDDLVRLVEPKYMRVFADFNVRGNIHTTITAVHGERSASDYVGSSSSS